MFILHNIFSTHYTANTQSINFTAQKAGVSEYFMQRQENKCFSPYLLTYSHFFFPNPNMLSLTPMERSEKLLTRTSMLSLMNEEIHVDFCKNLHDSKFASLWLQPLNIKVSSLLQPSFPLCRSA